MRQKIMLALLLFLAWGCEFKKSNHLESDESLIIGPKKYDCLAKQKEFLTWYLNNYEEINKRSHIIKYQKEAVESMGDSLNNASSTNYYQFSGENAERYLIKLKNTGYFSGQFIESRRASMAARGKVLNDLKLEDGPAEGFDFDEIFHTQEMYMSTDIPKLQVSSKNKNQFILPIMDTFSWIIYTHEEGNTCLIDSIGNKYK